MQERLAQLLASAVQFTLNVATTHYVRLTPMRYYLPEISAAIVGLVDWYYLRTSKGTHSEQFYSLQRTLKGSVWERVAAAWLISGGKLAVKRVLGGRFPLLETLYSVLKAGFMLKYLYFRGDYYSPEYYLLGHKLERSGVASGVRLGLFVVLLVLKALEFWFQSPPEARSGRAVGAVAAPFSSTQVPVNTCGLCRKALTNPTALEVSGYVFCYTCIKSHVDTFGNCPITGERCGVESLRKVRR